MIKYPILAFVLMLSSSFCSGQSGEFSIQFNSGFFYFGGVSSTESSFINISDVGNVPNYTNSPYGKSSGPSYGISLQYQKVKKSNVIYGVQAGYEVLSSKVTLDAAYGEIPWYLIEGNTILTHQFVNIHPYLGKRFLITPQIKIDLTSGFDFGLCLASTEHYTFKTNMGYTEEGTTERDKPALDFRARMNVTTFYKQVGFSIGYSLGVTNYLQDMDGGENAAFSRYLRLGVTYLLKSNTLK